MPDSWIVTPRTVDLPLSDGQWLRVKARLTAGEMMDLFERAAPDLDLADLAANPTGAAKHLSPMKTSLAMAVAYLVEWSVTDPDGKPLPLTGVSDLEKESNLRALDFDRFTEVLQAVMTHDTALRREKKRRGAVSESPIPSPSLVIAGGATNG